MLKLKWSKDGKKLVLLELLKEDMDDWAFEMRGKSVGQLAKERWASEALIYG